MLIIGRLVLYGVSFATSLTFHVRAALPPRVRGHAVTALAWTTITACQTVVLFEWRDTPNLIGHLVLLVAGWVMVSSWKQFVAQRHCGEPWNASRRPLAVRLITQTIAGPLALWLGAVGLCHLGQLAIDRASRMGDRKAEAVLRASGFECSEQRAREMSWDAAR